MTLSIVAAAALSLVLVLALHLRLSGVPHAVWSIARRERAQDGGMLLDSMKEAVAARSGRAVVAIQAYQEQIAQTLRVQIAEAETRARAAERRAAEAAKTLDAASDLLRELRAVIDAASGVTRRLHALDHGPRPMLSSIELEFADGQDERKTTEMPSAPSFDGLASIDVDFDFDDEDEKTRIADRGGSFSIARAAVVPPPRPPRPPLGPRAALDPIYAGAVVEPEPEPVALVRRLPRPATLLPPRPGREGCR
jgi:hypothetical protein